MQFHPNELFIYYDPTTNTGKQSRAIASSISSNINAIDSTQVKLTATLWKEIVNKLELRPKDLLNKGHADYQATVRGNTFTMNGWLDILAKNPQILRAPIAIFHDNAIICHKPTDLLKLKTKSSTGKTLPHLR